MIEVKLTGYAGRDSINTSNDKYFKTDVASSNGKNKKPTWRTVYTLRKYKKGEKVEIEGNEIDSYSEDNRKRYTIIFEKEKEKKEIDFI